MDTNSNFRNFDFEKVYKTLIGILEDKHNVKINTQIIKKEELNGKEN